MKQFIRFSTLLALGLCRLHSQPQIVGVYSASSFQPGLPSGGSLATLLCSGPSSLSGVYLPSSSVLPTDFAGAEVQVNGVAAPILAVVVTHSNGNTYSQVNFQVPMERNVSLPNTAAYSGSLYSASCGQPLKPLPGRPEGTFFEDANGYAIAQHSFDYSLVTPQNPAHPGETIIGYTDDVYPVWPSPTIGFPTPASPLFQFNPNLSTTEQQGNGLFDPGYLYLQPIPIPDVIFGLIYPTTPPLTLTFVGMAPGMVGVQQINFVIPAGQQPGTYPLFFNSGCPPGYVAPRGCSGHPTMSLSVLLPVG